MSADEASSGIETYAEFIKDELEAQDKRKTSFERGGVTVITTSGTLVTLLLAVTALSTSGTSGRAQAFVLPQAARDWLGASLLLFLGAVALAIVVNIPMSYTAVTTEAIKGRLREAPPRNADAAAKDIALTRLKTLEAAKRKNGVKGGILLAGMILQLAALACVARAIWLAL